MCCKQGPCNRVPECNKIGCQVAYWTRPKLPASYRRWNVSPSLSHVLPEGGIRFVNGCDTGILLCEVCSFSQLCKLHTGSGGGETHVGGGFVQNIPSR